MEIKPAPFKSEGQKLSDENKENVNSSVSPADQTNIDQTGSPDQDKKQTQKKDGDDNFAEHPRWIERENDWKERFNEQEKRHTDEIQKLRIEFTPKEKQGTVEVPAWFGGDEEGWKAYTQDLEARISKVKETTINEIKSKSEAEQKAIDDATNFFNSEVKSIEADKTLNPEGREIDRNKILKFALDNKLCDTEGRWNYRAAFKIMGAENVFKIKQTLNERKTIADAINSDKHSESKPQSFMTSNDFQKPGAKPW